MKHYFIWKNSLTQPPTNARAICKLKYCSTTTRGDGWIDGLAVRPFFRTADHHICWLNLRGSELLSQGWENDLSYVVPVNGRNSIKLLSRNLVYVPL